MKRLTLLSGEKSMTAIAFLFAVFLAAPCPFYILDEVEAALDDVNITRFLDLRADLPDRAQFIVVDAPEADDGGRRHALRGIDGRRRRLQGRVPAAAAGRRRGGRAGDGGRRVAPGRVASGRRRGEDRPMASQDDRITRRRFVGAAAGTLGAAALGGPAAALAKPPRRALFDHVVVLMMENRSFDHFLGWVPGADGRQAGLVYRAKLGVPHATHALAPDFQGCGFADPDHSYEGGRVETTGGRCDGWLRAGDNDVFSIGYYRKRDLSFLGPAVRSWTTFSRYFSGIQQDQT